MEDVTKSLAYTHSVLFGDLWSCELSKILLVEDDLLSCEFIRLSLEDEHEEVRSANSWTEGKLLCQEFKPDVLITDIELPDGSGIQLAREAGNMGVSCVIGITGYNRDHLNALGKDISVFSTLMIKPVDPERLKELLRPKA